MGREEREERVEHTFREDCLRAAQHMRTGVCFRQNPSPKLKVVRNQILYFSRIVARETKDRTEVIGLLTIPTLPFSTYEVFIATQVKLEIRITACCEVKEIGDDYGQSDDDVCMHQTRIFLFLFIFSLEGIEHRYLNPVFVDTMLDLFGKTVRTWCIHASWNSHGKFKSEGNTGNKEKRECDSQGTSGILWETMNSRDKQIPYTKVESIDQPRCRGRRNWNFLHYLLSFILEIHCNLISLWNGGHRLFMIGVGCFRRMDLRHISFVLTKTRFSRNIQQQDLFWWKSHTSFKYAFSNLDNRDLSLGTDGISESTRQDIVKYEAISRPRNTWFSQKEICHLCQIHVSNMLCKIGWKCILHSLRAACVI